MPQLYNSLIGVGGKEGEEIQLTVSMVRWDLYFARDNWSSAQHNSKAKK